MQKFFFAVMTCVELAGCAERVTPESLCSGDETKRLIKEIVRENWLRAADQAAISQTIVDQAVQLELAAPTKFDREIKRAECTARLSVPASISIDKMPDPILAALATQAVGNDFIGEGSSRRFAFMVSYAAQVVGDNLQVNLHGTAGSRVELAGVLLRAIASPTPVALTAATSVAPTAASPDATVKNEADGPPGGKYSDGAVTITVNRNAGSHGRDEYVSSVCANESFPFNSSVLETSGVAPYEVTEAPDGLSLTIAGSNRCMPAGTYQRL